MDTLFTAAILTSCIEKIIAAAILALFWAACGHGLLVSITGK